MPVSIRTVREILPPVIDPSAGRQVDSRGSDQDAIQIGRYPVHIKESIVAGVVDEASGLPRIIDAVSWRASAGSGYSSRGASAGKTIMQLLLPPVLDENSVRDIEDAESWAPRAILRFERSCE